jgi:hypothetical protein
MILPHNLLKGLWTQTIRQWPRCIAFNHISLNSRTIIEIKKEIYTLLSVLQQSPPTLTFAFPLKIRFQQITDYDIYSLINLR